MLHIELILKDFYIENITVTKLFNLLLLREKSMRTSKLFSRNSVLKSVSLEFSTK